MVQVCTNMTQTYMIYKCGDISYQEQKNADMVEW